MRIRTTRGSDLRLDIKAEFRQDAEAGGFAEEDSHSFDTFLIQVVVNVRGEIGANGFFWHRDAERPFGYERVDVLETVDAGLGEVVDGAFV